jgi:uncharacterized membrane protein YagU involved in acid resistance
MTQRSLLIGFALGLVATLAMSLLMLIGTLTDVSPMPKPIPIVIMTKLIGMQTAKPLRMILGIAAHFIYGGVWAALALTFLRPLTVWKGLGLGLVLWIGMLLVVLPLIGWGAFGSDLTLRIALATLILHATYGISLGLVGQYLDERSAQPALES